ncbi:hypothetical protein D9C11_19750 [Bacillus subtilis subsp. subtilis]|nr:hypothetical protein D9C11_19750 [Bacillus subtilis subsp. subtilis]CAF1792223.1 hypothetical protein NRS6120_04047 [Bacillus subtilis]CAI6259557.1 hypothetical protein NRS6120_08385 [Bacillus subtilis]
MGALFLHLKPDEYLKKLYKTKKLVEKTSFSLQAEEAEKPPFNYLKSPISVSEDRLSFPVCRNSVNIHILRTDHKVHVCNAFI